MVSFDAVACSMDCCSSSGVGGLNIFGQWIRIQSGLGTLSSMTCLWFTGLKLDLTYWNIVVVGQMDSLRIDRNQSLGSVD